MKPSLIVVLLTCNFSYSQINFIDSAIISEIQTEHNYITLKENIQIRPSDILNPNSTSGLRINNLNSFNITNSSSDLAGNFHYQYKQYFKGIPVEGSMLKLHCRSNGFVKSLNGKIVNLSSLDVTPSLNAQTAVQNAMYTFASTVFAWQDTLCELRIKMIKEDPNATYFPSPELCIYELSGNAYLVYKMFIETAQPKGTWEVFIDAQSGQLLKKEIAISACYGKLPNVKANGVGKPNVDNPTLSINDVTDNCSGGCHQASGSSLYYGYQYIYTDKYKPNPFDCKYRLKNTCTGTFIYTRNSDNNSIKEYSDQTTNWSYLVTQPGVTAHWCMERVHDYFRFKHNQNSFDNQFSQINVFTNAVYKFPNGAETDEAAYFRYSDNTINLGKGNSGVTFNDYTTLDIIGHEFSHGIDKYHGDIYGFGESGAIEESFGDIFGSLTEHYTKSNFSGLGNGNYITGEENFIAGGVRSLVNPKQFNHPDTYGGLNWVNVQDVSVANDYGGIHSNCGVQNYWFYLLCEGGSGTNDNNQNFCVKPIGKDKVGNIAYHTLTQYLGGNITFSNVRFYSIQAATDLYGANSDEVAQVTTAWYAVGVGNPFTGQVNYANQTVNSQTDLHYNSKVSLQNLTVNAPSLYVSSNTEIELLGDVNFNSGSWAELYIAPAPNCNTGARTMPSAASTTTNTHTTTSPSMMPSVALGSHPKSISPQGQIPETPAQIATTIQPNPNLGVFTLSFDQTQATPERITLYDGQGRVIKERNGINSYHLELDITDLTSGLYVVNVQYANQLVSKKIIKN